MSSLLSWIEDDSFSMRRVYLISLKIVCSGLGKRWGWLRGLGVGCVQLRSLIQIAHGKEVINRSDGG